MEGKARESKMAGKGKEGKEGDREGVVQGG